MIRVGRIVLIAGVLAAVCGAVWLTRVRFGVGVLGSGSMSPSLGPGDVVLYERRVPVRPGDIVVYDKPGWPSGVVHRVLERYADGSLRTRGDANPVPDANPVHPRDVRGKVVARLPLGRAFGLVTKTR